MAGISLDPDQIRTIREGLGLSQREAGSILGGGPNAFAKYESGTLAPAAALANLLLVLRDNPAALSTLRPDHAPVPARQPLPFQVTSQHVGRVGKQMFPQFLRLLLQAEALSHGIPSHGIHVADNVDAPDGGEDGRIQWQGGPEQTRFLPSRFTQFQIKTGDISPAAAGKEVLSKTGEVKPMVQSAFAEGATYMVLSTRTYTREQLEKREGRIRAALKGAGLDIDDSRVHFRDASQLAEWANAHPAVATWFLEKVEPGRLGPFRSWSHWARRREHVASPWVEDERISHLRQFLHQQAIAEPRKTARIVGLWGIGKSRLALEAFRPTGAGDLVLNNFSSLVLYAVESEVDSAALKAAVQKLADSRARAIVIVDECAPRTHRALVGMVERETSRLSLITLDDEIPPETLNASTHRVEEAPDAVTEAIVNRVLSELQGEDRRRLARFSRGFPRMSILIAQAWRESTPLAHATEQDLVKSYILGRNPDEADLVLKSARLLATFGLVDCEDNTQIKKIASFGGNLDLRAGVTRLTERGVARRWWGRYVSIEPRPIAVGLAEQQWQEWSRDTWDKVLVNSSQSAMRAAGLDLHIGTDELDLHVRAAKQLKLLNQLEIARSVVKHVCRYGGPLDDWQGIFTAGHAEVLDHLAEIDSRTVVKQLKRLLADVENLSIITDDSRSQCHLVWALEKIAFQSDTFEEGARLLLRLAAKENEQNNHTAMQNKHATRQFISLFPLLLAGTEAEGSQRLDLLDELCEKNDISEKKILIEALAEGLRLGDFRRRPGAEAHGARPALKPWYPQTMKAMFDYIDGCATRLAHFATQADPTGALARNVLGAKLGPLINHGFIKIVESVVKEIGAITDYWPRAFESLNWYLSRPNADTPDEFIDQVRTLMHQIEPKSLETRLRFLVTEMPWNYLETREDNHDRRKIGQRQVNVVRALAAEAIQEPETLRALLPQLSRGKPRMSYVFGQALAERIDSWGEWLKALTQALEDTPEAERSYNLLMGYIVALADRQPGAVEAFKKKVARSPVLSPTLPMICDSIGCMPSDLDLIIFALQNSFLSSHWLDCITIGKILHNVSSQNVAHLIDVLIDHNAEGFSAALILLGRYLYEDCTRLETFLRSQIRKIAESILRWRWTGQANDLNSQTMRESYFTKLITCMLKNEADDRDVAATAMAVAKAVATLPDVDYDYEKEEALQTVLPILLSKFSGIAWPLIGSAIISTERTYFFESFMGGGLQLGHQRVNSPLLSLPEDTLFAWCHSHPEQAPAFVARTVLFLTSDDSNSDPVVSVHPVMVRLLEDFGDRENVTSALIRNISSGGWSGSIEAFHQKKYEKKREPIKLLLEHPHKNVRRWAKDALDKIQTMLEQARNWDAHSQARFWE